MKKLTEGKWKHQKGKYLVTPSGEITSIPNYYDRDVIVVDIGRYEFKIHKMGGSKHYAYCQKYDVSFNYINDLVDWLNNEKAKYAGIDNR